VLAHDGKELNGYYRLMDLDKTVLAAPDDAVRPHSYSCFCVFLLSFLNTSIRITDIAPSKTTQGTAPPMLF
jgi:hypothetical protein